MDIAWHNTLKHIKITKTWQNTKDINKPKTRILGKIDRVCKTETVKKRMDERHFEALFFNQPQLENEITAKPR